MNPITTSNQDPSVPPYGGIVRLALPIILANSSTPLLGLADTAVIGNLAHTQDLGGVALGALIFSFVYWGFGFLRMSTSGFVAQASGRNDEQQILIILLRALLLAFAIGAILVLLQWPIHSVALELFGASDEVEAVTQSYFSIRIWSAPACLANYVLSGLFIGRGQGRQLLLMQLFLNGCNILFDLVFAGLLQLGATGIALGTALAETLTFIVFGWRTLHTMNVFAASRAPLPWYQILDRQQLHATLKANSDIMLRTLLLLSGFGIFNDQGARFGDTFLAANHLLLQFISFSAFFLDGFAFVAESLVGRAFGAKHLAAFNLSIQRTTILAGVTAVGLSAILWLAGPFIILLLTDIDAIRTTASHYLPFAAVYVLLSFVTFQLDGIFIGCTATRAMRNGALVSILIFIAVSIPLTLWLSNAGLWLAFIVFVITRAVCLGIKLPYLQQQCAQSDKAC